MYFFDRLLGFLRLASQPTVHLHPDPVTLVSFDSVTGEKRSTRLDEIINKCSSLVGKKAWYKPTIWLSSGHLSTIYCTLADFSYESCVYTRKLLQVPDGGTISLDITPPISPADPIDDRPILVICHGLTGGSHESYVINILAKVTKPKEQGGLGWRGCVVNFRGCANTKVTTKQLYSGAYTNDLRCGLTFLSHLAPNAPLYGTGFSLGANVMAKYLGEEGEATPIKAAAIIGCPWDFYAGHVFISSSYLQLVYSRAMASNLRRMIFRHMDVFEEDERIDHRALRGNPQQTLYEFDSIVTRVLAGYPSTEAYYHDASANQYAPKILVPTLSLNSLDDPIVGASTVPVYLAEENPNLVFVTTRHGGHLGWFSGLFRPRRWVVEPVMQFLQGVERADPASRVARMTTPKYNVEAGEPKVGDAPVLLDGSTDVGFQLVEESIEVADTGDGQGGGEEASDGNDPRAVSIEDLGSWNLWSPNKELDFR